MVKNPPLTHKRRAWASVRKGHVLRGKPLHYNAAVEEKYRNRLQALVRQMTAQTEREIAKLFASDHAKAFFGTDATVAAQSRIVTNSLKQKFEQLFSSNAQGLASDFVSSVNQASTSALHSSLKELSGGLSLKTSGLTPRLRQQLSAAIAENVSLIKSIPTQYHEKVQGAVLRSITGGDGANVLDTIRKYSDQTIYRAKVIAKDQNKKIYNNLNFGRMQDVGVAEYEWLHSGGDLHPRPEHVAMSGQIFRIDQPPVIEVKTGQRGKPGDAFGCTCKAIPVIKFDKPKEIETDDDGNAAGNDSAHS